jgi:hypothetical protein
VSPKTTFPERLTHGMLNIVEARQSSCHAVIASTMSSKRSCPGRGARATVR